MKKIKNELSKVLDSIERDKVACPHCGELVSQLQIRGIENENITSRS